MVKVLGTPVSGHGGSLGTLTQKSTFPNEFCAEMHYTDKIVQKNQKYSKKVEHRIYGYKMGVKTLISNSQSRGPKIFHKKWEPVFPKEFFSIKFGSYLETVSTKQC